MPTPEQNQLILPFDEKIKNLKAEEWDHTAGLASAHSIDKQQGNATCAESSNNPNKSFTWKIIIKS